MGAPEARALAVHDGDEKCCAALRNFFWCPRGPGQKVGFFSCDFAEPFLEVFSTVIFFLGGPRRAYACVVVVRNLDFLLFSTFDRSVTGTANHETVPLPPYCDMYA